MTDFFADLVAEDAPGAAARFPGLPRYNFVYGHIDTARVPTVGLAEAADRVIRREGARLGLYHVGDGPQGYLPLRKFVAVKLARRGIACTPEDILLTTGSLQAIELVNKVLVGPGDTVIIEEFTFGLAVAKARQRGAAVIAAPMDAGGLDTGALASLLADLRNSGVRPKYIYTIPTVHNPTGTVLDLARRHEMVDLSRRFGVPLVEDECYADLHWEGQTPPALYSLDPGRVVHIGSLSKTLAPALRIGYALADWNVIGRMINAKVDAGSAGLDQMVAAEYLVDNFADHVAELKAGLQRKLDVMMEAVAREFGTSVEVQRPKGGILLWLRFPEHVDTRTFHQAALQAGVAFNAGSDWACDPDAARNFMRLCFALPSEQDIADGVVILARVVHEFYGIPTRSGNLLR